MAEDNADQDWYGEDSATFGDRLAAARENARLNQDALATKLGVNVKTLRAWENDTKEPRANRLQMLSGLLGVSLSWLLTGRGEGLDAPEAEAEISAEVGDILFEIRGLRAEITTSGERLGQLEKRLRKALQAAE